MNDVWGCVPVLSSASDFLSNVEVETDEKDSTNKEWDERQEDELLEEASLLIFDSKLVFFLGQFVALALHEGIADVVHTFGVLHDCF